MEEDTLKCEVCGIPASLKCAGCKMVIYCGRNHQLEHWKKGHKNQCKCYELATNSIVGRHLITTRNIEQGEVILQESPLVIGPKIISAPMCLGCNKILILQNGERNYYKCSKCQWPMCNAVCESSKTHIDECKLMFERKFQCSINYKYNMSKESAYCAIVPLRCLLMKTSNKENYKKLMNLDDHLNEREDTPVYKVLKSNLLTFIKTILGMNEFEDTEIIRIAAILDTNAFEIRQPRLKNKIRGIYPTTAMVAHNCVPNARHVFDEKLQLFLIAAVDIPKGSMLSISYTQSLKATISRRDHLKQSKCFDCTCDRCKDPSEFGTYMGGIICSRCKAGIIISTDPLNRDAAWKCQNCEHELTGKHVILGNTTLQKEIEQLPKNSPKPLESFLEKYSETLHPKNMHMLQIKYALTQLYGNIPGFYLNELTDLDLRRKISLCNELLEIANKFEPGWSHFRGCLLLDLQDALVVQIKQEFKKNPSAVNSSKEKLQKAMDMLLEAVKILKVEPGMNEILQERVTNLSKQLN